MYKGFCASIVGLLAGVGLASADPAPKTLPPAVEGQQAPSPEPLAAPTPLPPKDPVRPRRMAPVAPVVVPVAPVAAVQSQNSGMLGECVAPTVECGTLCECAPCRFWVGAEYLLWWIKNAPMPQPLVTTGSLDDDFPGAIGQPGTRVLFGESDIDFGAFSGGRLSAGYWLDCEHTCAFEASGFVLEKRSPDRAICQR